MMRAVTIDDVRDRGDILLPRQGPPLTLQGPRPLQGCRLGADPEAVYWVQVACVGGSPREEGPGRGTVGGGVGREGGPLPGVLVTRLLLWSMGSAPQVPPGWCETQLPERWKWGYSETVGVRRVAGGAQTVSAALGFWVLCQT